MQEEVTQKTIALSVNVGKGAARLTEQALQKANIGISVSPRAALNVVYYIYIPISQPMRN